MEENKDNVKTPDAVVDKSGKEFKAVKQLEKKQKGQSNFGKSVAVPFLSGVLGATLVLGTCLGVPEIRSNIIRENNNNNNSVSASTSASTGTLNTTTRLIQCYLINKVQQLQQVLELLLAKMDTLLQITM